MPRFLPSLLLAASLLGCAATPATVQPTQPATQPPSGAGVTSLADLDTVTIPPLPDWVDKYSDTPQGDQRFFNMSRLMERFQLVRAQAVELQNHYRDLTRPQGADRISAFNTALERVRQRQFQSRIDLDQLAKARFIVVFDLDETLWDQYYAPEAGAKCHDLTIGDGKPPAGRYVKLAPGWQETFARIRELGGLVLLFSANIESTTYENLAQWKLDGVPLTESPAIAGILTNDQLILQEKSEGVTDPHKGSPVREPSKDLRIFDESLRRVIIVDDNPTRLFQMRNSRIIKKFDADAYCGMDRVLHISFDNSLRAVLREIEESVEYMNKLNVDFATAFLPYTSLGQVAVRFLMDGDRFERAQAIDYVRHHPQLVDPKY